MKFEKNSCKLIYIKNLKIHEKSKWKILKKIQEKIQFLRNNIFLMIFFEQDLIKIFKICASDLGEKGKILFIPKIGFVENCLPGKLKTENLSKGKENQYFY